MPESQKLPTNYINIDNYIEVNSNSIVCYCACNLDNITSYAKII